MQKHHCQTKMKLNELINEVYLPLLEEKNGFHILCEPEFKSSLYNYLSNWEKIRKKEKNYTPIPPEQYPELPIAPAVKNDFEWKWRKQSLALVEKQIHKKNKPLILDLACWNGWLSNALTEKKNEVLAVDLFADEIDGMACKKFYKTTWHSIQCDTENLNFLKPLFDVIVVNHALQFMPQPIDYCNRLKKLLKPDGLILLAGINFFSQSKKKHEQVESFKKHFKNKYNFSVFFKPCSGYLTLEDKTQLEQNGFRFMRYPDMRLHNLYSRVNPSKPLYCLGIFNASNK